MDLLKEIKQRKSVGVFLDKDIEKEKIDLMIEAARWAPSCFNNQPWNYVLFSRKDEKRAEVDNALKQGNSWAKKAPLLVVVGANPKDDCETNSVPYYAYDSGLSVMNFVLQAEHLGLKSHQMAGWNGEKMKKAAGFPEKFKVVVVFAVGYEANEKKLWNKLTTKLKEKVTRSRTRKKISDNFFFGKYGKNVKD